MAWVCRYCNHSQIPSAESSAARWTSFNLTETEFNRKDLGLYSVTTACLNCKRVSLSVALHPQQRTDSHPDLGMAFREWTLLPDSSGKPQPEFIPPALRADYEEACRIRDLSPKASATLARRCLQGMIRDFTGIKRKRLIDEIRALREALDAGSAPAGVTPESIDGIDAVREIGNIGAHMEKDVDLIVDIEPGEAQILIELVETLFDDWYVARHARRQRFAKVAALSAEKRLALEKVRGVEADNTGKSSG